MDTTTTGPPDAWDHPAPGCVHITDPDDPHAGTVVVASRAEAVAWCQTLLARLDAQLAAADDTTRQVLRRVLSRGADDPTDGDLWTGTPTRRTTAVLQQRWTTGPPPGWQ